MFKKIEKWQYVVTSPLQVDITFSSHPKKEKRMKRKKVKNTFSNQQVIYIQPFCLLALLPSLSLSLSSRTRCQEQIDGFVWRDQCCENSNPLAGCGDISWKYYDVDHHANWYLLQYLGASSHGCYKFNFLWNTRFITCLLLFFSVFFMMSVCSSAPKIFTLHSCRSNNDGFHISHFADCCFGMHLFAFGKENKCYHSKVWLYSRIQF